jgi:hypothetical protein
VYFCYFPSAEYSPDTLAMANLPFRDSLMSSL